MKGYYLRRDEGGLSYLEVLIATVVLAVSVVPVTTGLIGSLQTASHGRTATEAHFHVFEKMEEVLSYSFAELAAEQQAANVPTRFSDGATLASRRVVYIFAADGDNADGDNNLTTGGDASLLMIRTEYEDQSYRLEALRSRP